MEDRRHLSTRRGGTDRRHAPQRAGQRREANTAVKIDRRNGLERRTGDRRSYQRRSGLDRRMIAAAG